MINVLKTIYHSHLMWKLRERSSFVEKVVSVISGIYYGQGEPMTSKTCWRIYSIVRYFRYGYGLFRKKQIKNMSLSIDTEMIYISPDRIEYALLPSDSGHENTDPVEDGNWDLRKKKLGLNDVSSSIDSGEIKVRIDRNGSFLLEDGVSSLAASKKSGARSIPVRVTKRHYKWAAFRREVFLYSQEQPKGAYQQVIHPDFQNIRFHRRDDRWEIISKNIPLSGGSVLDIGSNWGYFCHKFEDLGFDCCAVEHNYRWLYFLKKFREIENRKFEIIPHSIFDVKRKSYDIVLALSIFQHFLKTKELYDRLTKLLGELDMKAMFFEPHVPGEGHKGAYVDYDEDDFASYIVSHSCLSKYKLLGRSERGRNIYLLS
jgi:hypothetical protein